MSAPAHTPGPWRYMMVTDTMPNFAIKASTGYGGPRVALVNYFAGRPSNQEVNDITEGEANARLIAAAPELLEVALGLADEIDRCGVKVTPELDQLLRSAIAKAEGRA